MTDTRVPTDNRSRVTGRVDEPLLEHTVGGLLEHTAKRFADHEAAIFCEHGERWTYRELLSRVDTLASGLLALGLAKGDRVGIWSPNRPEWLLAQFATARVGLILVNINPAYRLSELEFVLNKVACKALITAAQFKSSNYVGMLQELAPELLVHNVELQTAKSNGDDEQASRIRPPLTSAVPAAQALRAQRLPNLQFIVKTGADNAAGMLNFDDLMQLGHASNPLRVSALCASLSPQEPINIQFTSGTTGLPKGATLSHHNIVNNAHFVTATMNFSDQDRLCIPVPLYHCFGMVMGTLGCVSKGATMILPSEGFEPEATLAAVANERCTALYGVPTMFVAMLDHPAFPDFALETLRTGIMAGAPCPIEVMKKVQANMNMKQVTIAYGMTETSPVSFQSNVDDPLDKRVSSVGRVHPHVEVKIIDADGAETAVGEQGELCTRGYSVMQGYWDDDEQTHNSIDHEGWMHTGDQATIDALGYCNITGRVKDMIVRGGENVYPRDVEEYLYRMPEVAQVQVFGIPDDRLGEIVCAWIVLRGGQSVSEEQVQSFCTGQIAHYKIPAIVRIVDEIPMTVTGKAQKFIMRQSMMEQMGIAEIETA